MGHVAGKEQDYGDTARTVAANITRIRKELGITYTGLSEQLAQLHLSLSPVGVRRIEDCQRRVTVDDLMAIAVALRVSPATLLMPARNDDGDGSEVQAEELIPITGWNKPITARVVWEWLKAERPLVAGTFPSFVQLAWPAWERRRFDEQILGEIQRQQGTYVGEAIYKQHKGEEEVGRSLRLGLPDGDTDGDD